MAPRWRATEGRGRPEALEYHLVRKSRRTAGKLPAADAVVDPGQFLIIGLAPACPPNKVSPAIGG